MQGFDASEDSWEPTGNLSTYDIDRFIPALLSANPDWKHPKTVFQEAKEEGELGERPSSECWWDRVASRRPPKEDAREEGELALGDPYWRDAGAPEKE